MEKHIVYIITNSNRSYLEVGYCTDINHRLSEIHSASNILFGEAAKLSNLVYIATFDNLEKALLHQTQLQAFTRMQREKLIRLQNPNWLNLHHVPANAWNKKVVVYA